MQLPSSFCLTSTKPQILANVFPLQLKHVLPQVVTRRGSREATSHFFQYLEAVEHYQYHRPLSTLQELSSAWQQTKMLAR